MNQKARAVRLAEVQLVEHRENYTNWFGRDEWLRGRFLGCCPALSFWIVSGVDHETRKHDDPLLPSSQLAISKQCGKREVSCQVAVIQKE